MANGMAIFLLSLPLALLGFLVSSLAFLPFQHPARCSQRHPVDGGQRREVLLLRPLGRVVQQRPVQVLDGARLHLQQGLLSLHRPLHGPQVRPLPGG